MKTTDSILDSVKEINERQYWTLRETPEEAFELLKNYREQVSICKGFCNDKKIRKIDQEAKKMVKLLKQFLLLLLPRPWLVKL